MSISKKRLEKRQDRINVILKNVHSDYQKFCFSFICVFPTKKELHAPLIINKPFYFKYF